MEGKLSLHVKNLVTSSFFMEGVPSLFLRCFPLCLHPLPSLLFSSPLVFTSLSLSFIFAPPVFTPCVFIPLSPPLFLKSCLHPPCLHSTVFTLFILFIISLSPLTVFLFTLVPPALSFFHSFFHSYTILPPMISPPPSYPPTLIPPVSPTLACPVPPIYPCSSIFITLPTFFLDFLAIWRRV